MHHFVTRSQQNHSANLSQGFIFCCSDSLLAGVNFAFFVVIPYLIRTLSYFYRGKVIIDFTHIFQGLYTGIMANIRYG